MDTILGAVENAKHIVLIAHINPDADSLGSVSAMYTQMMRLHKKCSIYCVSTSLNQQLNFLPWYDKVRHTFPAHADLAMSFDCGAYERLGIEVPCTLINIDHHISNENYGDINLVDSSAISTTQVIYEWMLTNGLGINAKIATALYAGLLDDSNGFTHIRMNEAVFAMAHALVQAKAEHLICVEKLMHTTPLAALRLKGEMLRELFLEDEGRLAFLMVPCELMEQTGARAVDCEDALEESMHLPTVDVAVLLRENQDGSIKGSFRSKVLNANTMAKLFDGGGHAHAAGFRIEGTTLQNCVEKVKEIVKMERK